MSDLLKSKHTICEIDKPDVRWAMHEATLVGPMGAFSTVADITALAAVWGGLFALMAQNHGMSMNKKTATEICKSILLGVGEHYVGCKVATKFFHMIPVAGTFTAMSISSLANIVFTYRFALSLSTAISADSSYRNSWNGFSDRIITSFSGNSTIEDVKDICDIYFNPKYGYMGEVIDAVKEKADRLGQKAVQLSSDIITSPGFKKVESTVSDITDCVVDTVSDAVGVAFNVVDSIVDGTIEAVDMVIEDAKSIAKRICGWWK